MRGEVVVGRDGRWLSIGKMFVLVCDTSWCRGFIILSAAVRVSRCFLYFESNLSIQVGDGWKDSEETSR